MEKVCNPTVPIFKIKKWVSDYVIVCDSLLFWNHDPKTHVIKHQGISPCPKQPNNNPTCKSCRGYLQLIPLGRFIGVTQNWCPAKVNPITDKWEICCEEY